MLQLPSPPETNNIRVIAQYVNSLPSSGGVASAAWADITGKPTTVGGYGITDAYTKAASDARYQPAGSYQTAQTTLAGYGITDAYTKATSDSRYLASSYVPSWASITGKPTTLGGYGITDAYTAAASDARFLQLTGGTITGSLSVTVSLALRGLTVPTIQWGTAAPVGSASPGDEYIQYT